jgi:hypothetical protein
MSKPVQIKPERRSSPEVRKLARAILMLVEQTDKEPPKKKPTRRAS